MSTPSDDFSQRFDSIEIDPKHKPSADAIDQAMAFCAPPEAPGFYLIDDAGGRFVIDRDWGVISLKDEALMQKEQGAIHTARVKVIEQSGEIYELDLKLRMTGAVPQLIASDEIDDQAEPSNAPRIHWTRYVAVAGLYTPANLAEDETAPFGSALRVHLPCVAAGFAGLTIVEGLPEPAARAAIWTP